MSAQSYQLLFYVKILPLIYFLLSIINGSDHRRQKENIRLFCDNTFALTSSQMRNASFKARHKDISYFTNPVTKSNNENRALPQPFPIFQSSLASFNFHDLAHLGLTDKKGNSRLKITSHLLLGVLTVGHSKTMICDF